MSSTNIFFSSFDETDTGQSCPTISPKQQEHPKIFGWDKTDGFWSPRTQQKSSPPLSMKHIRIFLIYICLYGICNLNTKACILMMGSFGCLPEFWGKKQNFHLLKFHPSFCALTWRQKAEHCELLTTGPTLTAEQQLQQSSQRQSERQKDTESSEAKHQPYPKSCFFTYHAKGMTHSRYNQWIPNW